MTSVSEQSKGHSTTSHLSFSSATNLAASVWKKAISPPWLFSSKSDKEKSSPLFGSSEFQPLSTVDLSEESELERRRAEVVRIEIVGNSDYESSSQQMDRLFRRSAVSAVQSAHGTVLGQESDSEEEHFIKKTRANLTASVLKRHPWFDRELAWYNHFSVGSYWFGWAFLWMPLLIVVIPHQVERIVGKDIQGSSMGSVFLAGSLSSLILAPLFGHMSDCSQNAMGRRRPFIVVGVIITTLGLSVMALSPPFVIYCMGFFLASAGNYIALSPYAAIVPDVIPADQRGICSGWLGACSMFGYLLGGALSYHLEKLGMIFTYFTLASVHIIFAWITVRYVPEIPNVYYPLTSSDSLVIDSDTHRTQSTPKSSSSKAAAKAVAKSKKSHFSDSELDDTGTNAMIGGSNAAIGAVVVNTSSKAEDMCCAVLCGRDKNDKLRCFWFHSFMNSLRKHADLDKMLAFFDLFPFCSSDFNWLFVSRFFIQLGAIIVQENLQFYLKDTTSNYKLFGATLAKDEVQAVSVLFAPLLFGGLFSSIVSGIVSDIYEQKRKFLVYFSGVVMAVSCLLFGVNHYFELDLLIALFFGFGFGVFSAIDWAMATDVLPNPKCYGRDMGMWNLSFTLPQMVGAPLVGYIVDAFRAWHHIYIGWFCVFLIASLSFTIGTSLVKNIAHVK